MSSAHTLADAVVWVCWGGVGVIWAGGAIYNAARSRHTRKRSSASSLWMVVAIPAWLVARRVIGVDVLSLHEEPETVRLVDAVLLVVATGFTLWARIALGTMWSSSPVAKEGHVLHTAGPYAVTRHPIYTGILAMLIASAVALDFGAWLYILILVLIFFELRIRDEERLLTEAFPREYDAYRRRVPRLVPGLRLFSRPLAGSS
jgi:protein-S-isoprenylcysteine O-methyltransferase Ste14